MSVVKFSPPLTWDDETWTEVDLGKLADLTGRDKLAIMAELRGKGARDVLQPETDERYLLAAIKRATKIPQDALLSLPIRRFTALMMEAQGLLLGSEDGENPPSES